MNAIVFLLAAAVVALQVRDYKTTLDALKHDGLVEVGPPGTKLDWARKLMEKFGLKNGVLIAKAGAVLAVVAMAWAYTWSPSLAIPGTLLGALLYYGWVVWNNIRMKQGAKGE